MDPAGMNGPLDDRSSAELFRDLTKATREIDRLRSQMFETARCEYRDRNHLPEGFCNGCHWSDDKAAWCLVDPHGVEVRLERLSP